MIRLKCHVASLLVIFLGACASGSDAPKPVELGPNAALLGIKLAWTSKIESVSFPLDVKVIGTTVTVASSSGVVQAIDAQGGRELWRANVNAALSAGVGSDGIFTAVVTRDNEIVALEAGKEVWRQRLAAQGYTAPLVAGARVFVLLADRSVTAYDAKSGRKLWSQQRAGEPLVLRQSGVIQAVGDTLVVGLSGRLVGMSPQDGTVRWEAPIASPRGTNEIERLVDLVAGINREGNVVCVRAFQASVGCVNASRGTLLWIKPAMGSQGVGGDDKFIFGTESDGKIIAWRRADGERAWVSERLRYRGLTEPLAIGRSIAIGDGAGLMHFLSREDGSPLSRVATDGSAIVAAPVVAGGTLVVVTRQGGVFGFRPE
jgi:outer membrane assembly lipoprotein YfgL